MHFHNSTYLIVGIRPRPATLDDEGPPGNWVLIKAMSCKTPTSIPTSLNYSSASLLVDDEDDPDIILHRETMIYDEPVADM